MPSTDGTYKFTYHLKKLLKKIQEYQIINLESATKSMANMGIVSISEGNHSWLTDNNSFEVQGENIIQRKIE